MKYAEFTVVNGKRPRNELELPQLHFVVMDQWVEVIGERALIAWLKLYSWGDRATVNKDSWDESVIPRTLSNLQKKLGVGRATFYNKILKPLWNVGLVDIVEYEESKIKGTKPLNLVVYKYPQNNFSLAVEPLKEVRNYETDYHSEAKRFGRLGGRPSKKGESGGVLKENGGAFQNRTGGRSEIEHNNISNSITNNPNSINNNLDTIDTPAEQSKIPEKMDSAEREQLKERYFEKGFYENYEFVPKEISSVLKVFCSTKEAKEYYHILLLAKKKIEVESNTVIWLEEEPDLIDEIVNTFSRSIRKVEQERDVDNRKGYFYKAFYKTISDYVYQGQRLKNENDNHSGVYFDWLEDSVLGD